MLYVTNLNCSLVEKVPEYRETQHKVFFLHINTLFRTKKPVCDTFETLNWDVLSHAAYLPDLAPSDYHLFASTSHTLAEQRFGSYEDVKKRLNDYFTAKGRDIARKM